uniref:Major sperm protein n=1 Tax=Steinernema glaseri TaxID=37863 RepID=A0A1I7YRJ9_9BILA
MPQLPSTSEEACLVCGAPSHGVHFRVISCRACAAFFRRSLDCSNLYKCRRLIKNCDVSKNAKHNCRFCRFQKCKRVGMRYQGTLPHSSPQSACAQSPTMAALAADPPGAVVAATGGLSLHQLVNSGASRLAFKVKSTNNNEYRLKPVYGFVEPGASSPLEITRLNGQPKEDKFVVQFVEVPADATDSQAPFKAGGQQGEVVIPVKAE